MRSAIMEDWPTAMFAKGPAWTMHGWYSAVHMRVGLMVFLIHAVMAPPTSRSLVVTGLPLLSNATVISSSRFLKSARSVTIESMAINSDETAMPNLDGMLN